MLEHIKINLHFHSSVVWKHTRLLATKATAMIGRCKQAGIRPNDTNFFVNVTSDGVMNFGSFFMV
jgi:hypothetical protein